MNKDKDKVLSVFYNSACPVCNAGIEHQKHRMPGCAIQWNDVHNNNELIKQLNKKGKTKENLDFIRKRLHVKDTNGDVQVGLDAFIALWKISPGEHWKASIFSFPVIHSLTTVFYNVFALALFHWNKYERHW